jgi:arsenate reductase (thioredoxin)
MPEAVDVLFVCLHGSAKSVIAQHHFERLAEARGLSVASASAGVDVSISRPAALTADALAGAVRIVSFGCDLPGMAPIARWDDVPMVSDGYGPARDAIVARVTALLDELTAKRIGE